MSADIIQFKAKLAQKPSHRMWDVDVTVFLDGDSVVKYDVGGKAYIPVRPHSIDQAMQVVRDLHGIGLGEGTPPRSA